MEVELRVFWGRIQDGLARAQAEKAQDRVLAEQLLAKWEGAHAQLRREVDTLLQEVLRKEDKVRSCIPVLPPSA